MASFKDWNLAGDYADSIKFIIIKILPRLILAIILSLLFSSLDNYASFNEIITFIIFFSFLIYYFLPPSVDTIYIIKTTGDKKTDEINILKLLRASKDSYSGIYTLDNSFVIKSYYGKALDYYDKLKEKHNFEGYDVFRNVKSIKEFNEEYCKMLENVSWQLIEEKYGSQVVIYNINRIDTINL